MKSPLSDGRKAIRQNYGGRWVQDFTDLIKEKCDGDGVTIKDIEQQAFIKMGILPMKTDDLISQLIRSGILKEIEGKIIWVFGEIEKIEEKTGTEKLQNERPKYKGK